MSSKSIQNGDSLHFNVITTKTDWLGMILRYGTARIGNLDYQVWRNMNQTDSLFADRICRIEIKNKVLTQIKLKKLIG